jgi:hypothetical protein
METRPVSGFPSGQHADFPNLMIIMAHPLLPWQDAAISVATHEADWAVSRILDRSSG